MSDSVNVTPTPAAVRMRRYRGRRRDGLRCLTIELRETEVAELINRGFLRPDARKEQTAVLDALYAFLDRNLNP
jgi:hypothetical protein